MDFGSRKKICCCVVPANCSARDRPVHHVWPTETYISTPSFFSRRACTRTQFSTEIRHWSNRTTLHCGARSIAELHMKCMEQKAVDGAFRSHFVVDLITSRNMMRAMRDIKALAFVCALIATACATTDGGGGGDDGSNPPPSGTPVCGDAVCAASEVGVCQSDCGTGNTEVCGNGKCEGNEPSTCASDCNMGGGGVCGNGQCESSESSSTCPADCMTGGGGSCPSDQTVCFLCLLDMSLCTGGMSQATCQACILGGGGGGGTGCSGGMPNGMCEAAAGENNTTCPFDCP